jgi:hypothetical protein
MKDSWGISRDLSDSFTSADISEEIILGRAWLRRHNPTISFARDIFSWKPPFDDEPLARKFDLLDLGDQIQDQPARVYQLRLDIPGDDDLGDLLARIPNEYLDLAEVFSEAGARSLPPHRDADHAIDLEEGKKPPFGAIYSLSEKELGVLREYIDENLANSFIQPSRSSAGAPVLFAPKANGELRLCVDYRGLNAITIKNRYPLPLVGEILDRLSGAKIFTKIDIKNAYYRIRIRKGDEWKTAFRTRYGLYEYLVMPFGLTNAPASFQAYIQEVLREFLDVTVIVFMDDILVFSADPAKHSEHVREVLQALLTAGLYANLDKCLFGVTEVPFLGFVITNQGVAMEQDRVQTITTWPPPASIREIQVFIGFINFYRRFIKAFSRIAAPITEMLKGSSAKSKKERIIQTTGFLTKEAREAFHEMLKIFSTSPFLYHFNPTFRIRLETDASGFAICGILSQLHPEGWKPVAFFSRKMTSAERNYEIQDGELLAIVESFRHWRHYLEGANYRIEVLTDHNNLRSLMTTKALSRKQVRWALTLSAYDFVILYRKGTLNPADGPSRRPDYQREAEEEDSRIDTAPALIKQLFPRVSSLRSAAAAGSNSRTLEEGAEEELREVLMAGSADYTNRRKRAKRAVSEESMYENISKTLTEALPEFLRIDPFAARVLAEIASRENSQGKTDTLPGWTQQGELLYKENAIYIPQVQALRDGLLREHHDKPLTGHLGAKKTLNLLRRKYYWPKMRKDTQEWCDSCVVCLGGRVIRGKPQGTLQQLPIPSRVWDHLTMDFITDLPESRTFGGTYDSILVVVDRFSKMAHYIPCRKSMTAGDLAEVFIREIISRCGMPTAVVSDRGSLFTSRFWANLMYTLKIKRRLSTAFHPQTDGQTERQNSTLEQYLRSFVNFEQDDWAIYLPTAEFAYNAAVHSATNKAPFEVVYGFIPRSDMLSAEEVTKYTSQESSATAEDLAERLRLTREEVLRNLQRTQEYQEKQYNKHRKDTEFRVGQKVWLRIKYIAVMRSSRKLDWQRYGPFAITKRIGKVAYELDLPEDLKIHNVFHVSLLREHRSRKGEATPEPEPLRLAVDPNLKEYEVQSILESRIHDDEGTKTLQYRVAWKGYKDTMWIPAGNAKNARRLVNLFHKENPNSPAGINGEIGGRSAKTSAKAGTTPGAKRRGRPPKNSS